MGTLTAADSSFFLGIENLYDAPQPIQGYSTDDAFAAEDIVMGETMMGVDGKLSAGFVPAPQPLTITLQADSPSCELFDQWMQAEKATKSKYTANGVIRIPALNLQFVFTKGFLVSGSPMPAGKKVLQPRSFTIHFEKMAPAPI